MPSKPPKLTIDFLEDAPDGLRSVSSANWSIECLLCSRGALSKSLKDEVSRKELDVPGVYLLLGPPKQGAGSESQEPQLYIGQGDSVADRLTTHLRNEDKRWFRAAMVIRRQEKNPLNLTLCKFLESELCSRALTAGKCSLDNKVGPRIPNMPRSEISSAKDFLEHAVVIVAALGWNFFEQPEVNPPPKATPAIDNTPPAIPPNLKPLFEEIRSAVADLPNTEWYWTHTPDYRAKVISDGDFRVFYRIRWAKNWFWVQLKDVGKFKVASSADLAGLSGDIQKAHRKAEQYLQRGK